MFHQAACLNITHLTNRQKEMKNESFAYGSNATLKNRFLVRKKQRVA